MRFSWLAFLAFTAAATAGSSSSSSSSNSLDPDSDGCFEHCFKSSGCDAGDVDCYCHDQAAADKTACCVSKECSPEAQKIIGIFAHVICIKGSAKHPPHQADGCKKSGDSKSDSKSDSGSSSGSKKMRRM